MEQEQEQPTFTKGDVVNAVLFVCKRVPGWYPTKEWVEHLCDGCKEKLEGKTFDQQVDLLGAEVRYMYLSRYVKYYDGIRLDNCIFRRDADNFVSLIWWSKSFANKYMTNILNRPIVL